MKENKNSTYHYLIVLAGFICFGMNATLTAIRGSLFTVPVTTELGYSVGAFSMVATLMSVGSLFSAPIYSVIMGTKINKKYLLLFGSLTTGFLIFLNGFASNIWIFYAFGAITSFASPAITAVLPVMMANWFVYKRATMMGFMYAGSGAIGALMTPLIANIIVQYGWSMGYHALGLIAMFVPLPFILFIIKMHPSEKGMEAFQAPVEADLEEEDKKTSLSSQGNVPYKVALKSKVFILYAFVMAIGAMILLGCQFNTIPYLVSIGYTQEFAALILSVYMICNIFGKIILGFIFDKCSTLKAGMITSGFGVLVVLCLILAPYSKLAIWAYALLLGLFVGSLTIPSTIILPHIFGIRTFGQLMPLTMLAASFGMALGVPLAGFMYDITGSFRSAWIAFLCLGLLAVFAYPLIFKLAKSLEDKKVTEI